MRFMRRVNESICIPGHGTVESYQRMMAATGFEVTVARDMFEGIECWGSTPNDERPQWLDYQGPAADQFREGKVAHWQVTLKLGFTLE